MGREDAEEYQDLTWEKTKLLGQYLERAETKRDLKRADYEALEYVYHANRLRHDQYYRLNRMMVVDKEFNMIPMRFKPAQDKVYGALMEQKRLGLPERVMVLKSRRQGISTLVGAYFFDETIKTPNMSTLVMAHEMKTLDALFGMHEIFYDNYFEELWLPAKKKNAARNWKFEEMNSSIQVATGKNLKTGRGLTTGKLHVSEVAWIGNAEKVMLGMMQTVARKPGTTVVLETTANGIGGYFHDNWWKAYRSARKDGFTCVFVPWFDDTDCSSRFIVDEEKRHFKNTLTEEEQLLRKTYKLTLEQLRWRRITIEDECGGDERMFRQEYPATAREAFLTSGENRFLVHVLDSWHEREQEYQHTTLPKRFQVTEEGEFISDPYGEFQVFEEPVRYKGGNLNTIVEYIIGVDVAQGIEVSTDGRERDDSCIQVLRRGNMAVDAAQPKHIYDADKEEWVRNPEYEDAYKVLEQVAVWTGKCEPIALANIAYHIGMWYNKALMVVENNQSGASVLSYLNHYRGERYPFLYSHKITDKTSMRESRILGFSTTTSTRPVIIDTLAQMVKDEDIVIHDLITIDQMMTFKREKNKVQAETGKKDDTVMALAVAVHANMSYRDFKNPIDSLDEDDGFKELLRQSKLRRSAVYWTTGKNPDVKKKKSGIQSPYAPIGVE